MTSIRLIFCVTFVAIFLNFGGKSDALRCYSCVGCANVVEEDIQTCGIETTTADNSEEPTTATTASEEGTTTTAPEEGTTTTAPEEGTTTTAPEEGTTTTAPEEGTTTTASEEGTTTTAPEEGTTTTAPEEGTTTTAPGEGTTTTASEEGTTTTAPEEGTTTTAPGEGTTTTASEEGTTTSAPEEGTTTTALGEGIASTVRDTTAPSTEGDTTAPSTGDDTTAPSETTPGALATQDIKGIPEVVQNANYGRGSVFFSRSLKGLRDGDVETEYRCFSTIYEEEGEEKVIRGCTAPTEDVEATCREAIGGDFEGVLKDCKVCSTDLCNAAAKSTAAIVLLLICSVIHL